MKSGSRHGYAIHGSPEKESLSMPHEALPVGTPSYGVQQVLAWPGGEANISPSVAHNGAHC